MEIVQEGEVWFEIQEVDDDKLPYRARLFGTESWCSGASLREAIVVAAGKAGESAVEEALGDLWEKHD